jgi:hypothetical protein
MSLLVGLPEISGGRVRGFTQQVSSPHWLCTLIYPPGMNSSPVAAVLRRKSYPIDMINQSSTKVLKVTVGSQCGLIHGLYSVLLVYARHDQKFCIVLRAADRWTFLTFTRHLSFAIFLSRFFSINLNVLYLYVKLCRYFETMGPYSNITRQRKEEMELWIKFSDVFFLKESSEEGGIFCQFSISMIETCLYRWKVGLI